MRLVDNPNRPTEIDGYEVQYFENGAVLVDRDIPEQIAMLNATLPQVAYLIEKWGYAPVVSGCCADESYLRARELPLWYCNNAIMEDGSVISVELSAFVSYRNMSGEMYAADAAAIPVNPFTREVIMTREQAESLDLSGYTPDVPIKHCRDTEYSSDYTLDTSEPLIEVRDLLHSLGYVPPETLYQYPSHEDDE